MPIVYAPRIITTPEGQTFTLPGEYAVKVDADGTPLSFTIEPSYVEGKGIAPHVPVKVLDNDSAHLCPEVKALPTDRTYVMHGEPGEMVATTIWNGKRFEVEKPDLVMDVADTSHRTYLDRDGDAYCPDTLASFISSGKAVSEALEDIGFSNYVDVVYVDGMPGGGAMGVLDFGYDTDAMLLIKEVCPTFTFRYNGLTGDPGAYCKCGVRFLYREYAQAIRDDVALSGGFEAEVYAGGPGRKAPTFREEALAMQAFVADVVNHAAVKHPGLTADDFCDHGQRRFVTKPERPVFKTVWVTVGWDDYQDAPIQRQRKVVDTDAPKKQAFKARFCPKGKCDPIWDNS